MTEHMAVDSSEVRTSRRRLLLALPAFGFTAMARVLVLGPNRDPSKLPSMFIGQ